MEEDFTESHLRSVGESRESDEENEIAQDREPSRRPLVQESLPKDESESGVSNISTPEEQSTTSGTYGYQESRFRVKSGVSDDQSSESIRKSEKTSEIKKRLSTEPIMPARGAKLFISKSLPFQESTASRFPESLQREHLDSTLHPLDLSRKRETKSSLSTDGESVSETMDGVHHDPESKDQHEHTSEIRRRLSSQPMLPAADIDILSRQRLPAAQNMTRMETESREKNGSGCSQMTGPQLYSDRRTISSREYFARYILSGQYPAPQELARMETESGGNNVSGLCSQMTGPQLVSNRLTPSSGELSTVQDQENQSTKDGSTTSKSANHQENKSSLSTEGESVSETIGGFHHDPESKGPHEHTSEIRRRLFSEPMLPVADIDILSRQRLPAAQDMTRMETESREKKGSGCSQMTGPQLDSDGLTISSGELEHLLSSFILCLRYFAPQDLARMETESGGNNVFGLFFQMTGPQLVSDRLTPSSGELSTVQDQENQSTKDESTTSKSAKDQENKSSLSTEGESVSETISGFHNDPESKGPHEHTSEIRRRLSSGPMLSGPDIDILSRQRLPAAQDMTRMETESRENVSGCSQMTGPQLDSDRLTITPREIKNLLKYIMFCLRLLAQRELARMETESGGQNVSGLSSQGTGPQLVSDRLTLSSGELSTEHHSLEENQTTKDGNTTSKSANHEERRSILADLLSSPSRFASPSKGVGEESPDKSLSTSASETSEKMLKLSLSDLKTSCANFFDNAPRRIEEFLKLPPSVPQREELSAVGSLEEPAAGPSSLDPAAGPSSLNPAAGPSSLNPAAGPSSLDPAARPPAWQYNADRRLTYEEYREIRSRICDCMSRVILERVSEIPEPHPRTTRASNFQVPRDEDVFGALRFIISSADIYGTTSFQIPVASRAVDLPVPHGPTSETYNPLVHNECNSGPSGNLVSFANTAEAYDDEYSLEYNLPENETVYSDESDE